MRCNNKLLISTAVLALTTGSAGAIAQTASSPAPSASSAGLEEIVVTAQKREEKLQSVPVAVSAFNAQTLQSANVDGIADMAKLVPSLTISQSASGLLPFLRGIGNASTVAGNEASTALYVDGVYYTRLPTPAFDFSNIERIEVLQGPQGTLFGRNASGGLIQVITRDPSYDPKLDINLGYANYDTKTASIYGSIGVTDKVAADLSMTYRDQGDGWGHYLLTGNPYGYTDDIALRSKVLIDIDEDTSVKISGDYMKAKTTIGEFVTPYQGTTTGYPTPPLGPLPYPGFYNSYDNTESNQRTEMAGGSVKIRHDMDFADFSSLTAYHALNEKDIYDFDYTPRNYLYLSNAVLTRFFSEEAQLQSKKDSPFDWTFGVYYASDYTDGRTGTYGLILGGLPNTFSNAHEKTDSYAGYGQATFHVLPDTNLTLGVRYSVDELSYGGHNDTVLPSYVYVTGNSLSSTKNFYKTTEKAVLDHHFGDDLMVYASYSTGYKAGVYNLSSANTVPPVSPELITAYELGAKSEFFDNRLRLNAAAFFYSIGNPQVQIRSGTAFILVNAKAEESKGIDFDGALKITDALTAHAGLALLDAHFTSFTNAPAVAQNPNPPYGNGPYFTINAAGKYISRSPPVTFNIGADYDLPSNFGDFKLSANYAYNSGFYWTPDNAFKQNAYSLLDAQISYTLPDNDHWKARIWGKNLTDTKYYTYGTEANGAAGFTGAPAAPMTFGFNIDYHL